MIKSSYKNLFVMQFFFKNYQIFNVCKSTKTNSVKYALVKRLSEDAYISNLTTKYIIFVILYFRTSHNMKSDICYYFIATKQ